MKNGILSVLEEGNELLKKGYEDGELYEMMANSYFQLRKFKKAKEFYLRTYWTKGIVRLEVFHLHSIGRCHGYLEIKGKILRYKPNVQLSHARKWRFSQILEINFKKSGFSPISKKAVEIHYLTVEGKKKKERFVSIFEDTSADEQLIADLLNKLIIRGGNK